MTVDYSDSQKPHSKGKLFVSYPCCACVSNGIFVYLPIKR